MSKAPLPSQIDIRKLAVKGVEISASTSVSTLPRFVDLLANDSSSIDVDLCFYIDEERFRRVDGRIQGSVEVFCQRCLEPMPLTLDTRFSLGIVWSEDDAERLPSNLDPLIVGEELVDLADIVSEELILCLPFVSYHEPGACRQLPASSSGDTIETGRLPAVDDQRENPFEVLKNMKFDK